MDKDRKIKDEKGHVFNKDRQKSSVIEGEKRGMTKNVVEEQKQKRERETERGRAYSIVETKIQY